MIRRRLPLAVKRSMDGRVGALANDTMNWLDFLNAGQSLIEALEAVTELPMINAEAVEDGRV